MFDFKKLKKKFSKPRKFDKPKDIIEEGKRVEVEFLDKQKKKKLVK